MKTMVTAWMFPSASSGMAEISQAANGGKLMSAGFRHHRAILTVRRLRLSARQMLRQTAPYPENVLTDGNREADCDKLRLQEIFACGKPVGKKIQSVARSVDRSCDWRGDSIKVTAEKNRPRLAASRTACTTATANAPRAALCKHPSARRARPFYFLPSARHPLTNARLFRILSILLLLSLVLGTLSACLKKETKHTASFFAMDTVISVTLYTDDADLAERQFSLCRELLTELDGLWSRHTPDSDVGRLNLSSNGVDDLDPRTVSLLIQAKEISQATGGTFDITLAPLSDLWQACGEENRLPDADELAALLTLTGTERLQIGYTDHSGEPEAQSRSFPSDDDTVSAALRSTVSVCDALPETDEPFASVAERGVQSSLESKENTSFAFMIPKADTGDTSVSETAVQHTALQQSVPDKTTTAVTKPDGMQIDLGGIGKGAAVSMLIGLLEESGISGGLISFGSSVAVFGAKPDGSPFRIALRDPQDAAGTVGELNLPAGSVLSVSGDYERYVTIGGQRYHHILDPETGMPAQSGLCSVAVICRDGALADALSTALFVMGTEEAMRFYESGAYEFEAILIASDGTLITTPGLTDFG